MGTNEGNGGHFCQFDVVAFEGWDLAVAAGELLQESLDIGVLAWDDGLEVNFNVLVCGLAA